MTREELDREIERLLKRNQAAIQRAKRPQRLIRIAERSDPALERALERLRQNVR